MWGFDCNNSRSPRTSIYCSVVRVMRIVTKWLRLGSCSFHTCVCLVFYIVRNRFMQRFLYQSVNQWCWQTHAHLSLYVRIVLRTLVLVSNNSSIKLRSISGTGKVGSVINFHIFELPKVIKSRLKYFNRVNINYSIRLASWYIMLYSQGRWFHYYYMLLAFHCSNKTGMFNCCTVVIKGK